MHFLFFLLVFFAGTLKAEKLPRAHVVVHKDVNLCDDSQGNFLVRGKDFDVTYTIRNIGKETAYDISVSDQFLPEDQFMGVAVRDVNGKIQPPSNDVEISLDVLEPGETKKYVLTLNPQVVGTMAVGRAQVSYKFKGVDASLTDTGVPEIWEEAQSSSSTPGKIEIIRVDEYERLSTTHVLPLVLSAITAIALVVLPYFQWKNVQKENQMLINKKK